MNELFLVNGIFVILHSDRRGQVIGSAGRDNDTCCDCVVFNNGHNQVNHVVDHDNWGWGSVDR